MITQELIAYIKAELNKGKTREDIRVALLSGGGWSEEDVSEVFRMVMPLNQSKLDEKKPVVPAFGPAVPASSRPSASSSIHWKPIIFSFALGGIIFVVFYFFRPQVADIYDKTLSAFSSVSSGIGGLFERDEEPEVASEDLPPAPPAQPAPLPPRDCGTTNSPDRKNLATYENNSTLKCLGESAIACQSAYGTVNDPFFPTFFGVTKNNEDCLFQLSYKADSELIDVLGKSLAGRSISCPLGVVKTINETIPLTPIFESVDLSNTGKYATDIYFYGTLGLFIENNFDENKILSLGCHGTFVKSVIESYNLMKKN